MLYASEYVTYSRVVCVYIHRLVSILTDQRESPLGPSFERLTSLSGWRTLCSCSPSLYSFLLSFFPPFFYFFLHIFLPLSARLLGPSLCFCHSVHSKRLPGDDAPLSLSGERKGNPGTGTVTRGISGPANLSWLSGWNRSFSRYKIDSASLKTHEASWSLFLSLSLFLPLVAPIDSQGTNDNDDDDSPSNCRFLTCLWIVRRCFLLCGVF